MPRELPGNFRRRIHALNRPVNLSGNSSRRPNLACKVLIAASLLYPVPPSNGLGMVVASARTFRSKRMTRMKTIALIDTRLEVPGVSLGILVSTHPDVMAAFAANDAFQKAEASGRHIRTKIVTLKDRLDVGQPVQQAHLAESQ